ncbi:MAG: nitroreductase family protein [Defluviitaleaceae bacterium]|nr:nitroreductase family protein [Defluviitaleaceae bacterium]
MNLFEAIETRYSHKELFLPEPVPMTHLEQIAKAGITAPSGNNRQTVRLIILPNKEAIKPLNALTPHGGLGSTSAAIAVFTDTTLTPDGHMNFDKENYSAAMQNMLLAATALGYSSLWLDYIYFNPENEKAAKELLGIPEACRLWALVPIGKPDGLGSRREKLPYEERVFYGNYSAHKS